MKKPRMAFLPSQLHSFVVENVKLAVDGLLRVRGEAYIHRQLWVYCRFPHLAHGRGMRGLWSVHGEQVLRRDGWMGDQQKIFIA